MTQLLWLSLAVVALTIWIYRHRSFRGNDLGTISARWLQEYRNETHQER